MKTLSYLKAKAVADSCLFDPHLLVNLTLVNARSLAVIDKEMQGQNVCFVYDGKCCSFRYHILNQASLTPADTVQMALELSNPALHAGYFYNGKEVMITVNSTTIAVGSVAEVMDETLLYWTPALLPGPLVGTKAISKQDDLESFCMNLEFGLCKLSFIKDYTVHSTKGQPVTIELTVPNQTITQAQAQKLEKLVRSQPYAHCFYKVDYTPMSFGLMDLILQNYSALFIVGNAKRYFSGQFIVA